MKRSLFTAVLGFACAFGFAQAPAPAPVPAAPIKLPSPAVAPTPAALLQQLQMMRDANAKLLEQQTKALVELEEMEKAAQSIKMLGKRS